MKNKQFAEGVSIISKYIPEGEEWNLNSGHDQIWYGSYEWVTDEDDIKRLSELGWFVDEDSWSCNV